MTHDGEREERCELRNDTLAARQGRRFVRALLARHGVDGERIDVAELLTSELVTNALLHGTEPRELRCAIADDSLTVVVWDSSDQPPRRRSPTVAEPHGRGLQLVAELADQWGVDLQPGQGKQVWFTSRLDRTV